MKIAQLRQKIAEYLKTQPEHEDEWYGPIRELHAGVLDEFTGWLVAEDTQKQERRKQWEELNKEFGGEV